MLFSTSIVGFDMAEAYKWYFQFPYVHESDVVHVPSWVHSAVFYQIFPERFRLGNTYKDKSYINVKWGGKVGVASFAGGDLRGIIDSLDYIQGLGVNAIYLNPIFAATTNHAYDTMDYFKIEPRFGTEEDLKELIEKLHARGMHLVLDAVFNHVSYFSPLRFSCSTKERASRISRSVTTRPLRAPATCRKSTSIARKPRPISKA